MDALDLHFHNEDFVSLGQAVGSTLAFNIMAGRCNAAQAESFSRIRDQRLYKNTGLSWKDFCPRYFKMSSSQVDRIIQLWNRFGPGYFELAQLTRISPEIYRFLQPHIKDGAIHFNKEAIELDPSNAEKIADMVAELRQTLVFPEPPDPTPAQLLAAFERSVDHLHREFINVWQASTEGDHRTRLQSVMAKIAVCWRTS